MIFLVAATHIPTRETNSVARWCFSSVPSLVGELVGWCIGGEDMTQTNFTSHFFPLAISPTPRTSDRPFSNIASRSRTCYNCHSSMEADIRHRFWLRAIASASSHVDAPHAKEAYRLSNFYFSSVRHAFKQLSGIFIMPA